MRLSVIDTRTAPSCLRHLPAVEILALGVDAELWLHIQTLNQARSIQKLQQLGAGVGDSDVVSCSPMDTG